MRALGLFRHACVRVLSHFSPVQLFAAPWTVAHQAPLSMGFSRQEYGRRLPCPPAGDLPDPGMEPRSLMSPVLANEFFTTSAARDCTFLTLFPCLSPFLYAFTKICYLWGRSDRSLFYPFFEMRLYFSHLSGRHVLVPHPPPCFPEILLTALLHV